MEHLLKQIMDATRALELATHEIHKRDARIHDLEIENQRLRDHALLRSHQYHELAAANHGLTDKVADLEARIRTNRDRIRRMEEGEL